RSAGASSNEKRPSGLRRQLILVLLLLWKPDCEACTAVQLALDGDSPAMPANRDVGSGQTESGSRRTLCGEEWIEYASLCFRRDPDALVGEPGEYLAGTDAGLDEKAPSRSLHGVERIENDVYKDLAELRAVAHNRSHFTGLNIDRVVDTAGPGIVLPADSGK